MSVDPHNPAPSATPTSANSAASDARRAWSLGTVLVVAVLVAGSPSLDAPWLMGDESRFIVGNPLVNPANVGNPGTLTQRLGEIFTTVHNDLYQPVPIATYTLEWAAFGGRAWATRLIDVLIHACNGLLVWLVLHELLCHATALRRSVSVVAWACALLWTLHPMSVDAFAADMGRTHMLSATFALLAFWCHVRSSRPGTGWLFAAAPAALCLAMMCKPVPGWFVAAAAYDLATRGSRTWRSPRIYFAAVICTGFAYLAWHTSRASGIVETSGGALFGDPIARSLAAIWLYAHNVILPLSLAHGYYPDPDTGWMHLPVWIGMTILIASLIWSWWAVRKDGWRAVAIGWLWCWVFLAPTVGLVSARELAAADRYFYLPAVGVLLVLATIALRVMARLAAEPRQHVKRIAFAAACVLSLAYLVHALPETSVARSTLRRAAQTLARYPDDPRAWEAVIAARDFARNHPLPRGDAARIPAGLSQFRHFNETLIEALDQAAAVPDLPRYFPDPQERAAYFRRLAYRYLLAGRAQESLATAEQARTFAPNDFRTWKRLAHANQASGDLPAAVAAYARCEELLLDDPFMRAAHYTDFGSLLMFDLEDDRAACAKFQAALETGVAPTPAQIGWALCEIRYGEGQRGFELISAVLEQQPGNIRAGLVLAEYHLRGHHFDHAAAVYAAILQDRPTNYDALRGFHEVCVQLAEYEAAAFAWQEALAHDPTQTELESYLVWTMALGNRPEAGEAVADLLRRRPDDRWACLAQAIIAIRNGDQQAAIDWARRAVASPPIPGARVLQRGAATLRLLATPERRELPPAAILCEAALHDWAQAPPSAKRVMQERIETFIAQSTDERNNRLARTLLTQIGPGEDAD